MECYNVPVLRAGQAVPDVVTGLRAAGQIGRPGGRRSRCRLAAAGLLAAGFHGVAAFLVLTAVHRAVAPGAGETPSVAVVFAPPQGGAEAAVVPKPKAPGVSDAPPPPVADAPAPPAAAPQADAAAPASEQQAVGPPAPERQAVESPLPERQAVEPPAPVRQAVEPPAPELQAMGPPAQEPPVATIPPAPQAVPASAAPTKAPPSPAMAAHPRMKQPTPPRRHGTVAPPAPPRPAVATPAVPRTTAAAVAADPSAAPQAERARAGAAISGGWQHALAVWLAAHKAYPEAARQRGEEGVAVLRFTVERSGRVLAVAVVRSAGSPILDAAAEAMVRNGTVPPFPPEMTQDKVTVTVQVRYALAD